MFNIAIREWQWLKVNPVSGLSFSVGNKNARTRWLTPEEEEKLLLGATNPAWLRTLIVTPFIQECEGRAIIAEVEGH